MNKKSVIMIATIILLFSVFAIMKEELIYENTNDSSILEGAKEIAVSEKGRASIWENEKEDKKFLQYSTNRIDDKPKIFIAIVVNDELIIYSKKSKKSALMATYPHYFEIKTNKNIKNVKLIEI